MPLLPPATREQLPSELLALWDECAHRYPHFRHLWATMANSPTIFVWGQLLELKHCSPVAARHFEIGIVVVSALGRRLYARLTARFSPRQLEELTWRLTQCVAFNWHNKFFEIDDEPA